MITHKSVFLGLLSLFFLSNTALANQQKHTLRKLLSNIHWNISTGGGGYYGEKKVFDARMYRKNNALYAWIPDNKDAEYLLGWFDSKIICITCYDNTNVKQGNNLNTVKFRYQGPVMPLTISAHVDCWQKLRIGLGATGLLIGVPTLKPDEDNEELEEYVAKSKLNYGLQLFGLMGYPYLDCDKIKAFLEFAPGLGLRYNASMSPIQAPQLLFRIGTTTEWPISQNKRFFTSLYCVTTEGLEKFCEELDRKGGIVEKHYAVRLEVGISFNIPRYAPCPFTKCCISTKHRHGGKLYRGKLR